MPSSPPQPSVFDTSLSPSLNDGGHGEDSPLLPQRSSGMLERNSNNSSGSRHHRRRPRGAASRDISSTLSDASAATATAASLSMNIFYGDGSSFGNASSSGGGRSDESDGSTIGSGRGSVFGAPPTSISGLLTIFSHSVALQTWASYVLAVGFHLFHVLLILSFILSPILLRSTIFSSQTMAKPLLEAHGILKAKGSTNINSRGRANAPLLPSSVSKAAVSVENVWAIHDAVFFLEPGHVVMPTSIGNSFGSLRRRKNPKKGAEKNKKNRKGGAGGAADDSADVDAAENARRSCNSEDDEKKDANDDTHAYIVPHGSGEDGVRGKAKKLVAVEARVSALAVNDVKTAQEGEMPLHNFAVPPPVAPKLPHSQRKSSTHGQATLSKMLDAWEASPLYSSPLSLTLFYYLYVIGCIVLLLTVTDGKLTGHFSVLRLVISLAELLWYVHHGAHAFVIYCWMCLLSHWPHHASYAESDVALLRSGTPYVMVSKESGEVAMYWFYRATAGRGAGGDGSIEEKIFVGEINMKYYLYDQMWYLKPAASAITVAYLVLLSLCIARDLHRLLDAVVGVRVLMEPEGCVRCPLCGELMEICHQRSYRRGRSIYQSAREGTSLSVRRTMWWWRWIRSAVRGSRSGRHVSPPRLRSPLWCWLLPGWCGGGPQGAREGGAAGGTSGDASQDAIVSVDAPYTVEEVLENIDFYEESAVRRSAAAPQDTVTDETAHLMRWLTVVPKSDAPVAVPLKEGRRCSSSSDGEEAVDALGIGSSGSSSEDEVERGLVKAMPAGADPTRRLSAKASAGPREAMRHDRSSGQRSRHNAHTSSSDSSSSSPQRVKQRRVSRLTGEKLYWNYATRHVHHRCPKLYLDAQEAMDDDDDDTDSEDTTSTGSTNEASSSADSSIVEGPSAGAAAGATAARGAAGKDRRVTGTLATPAVASHHANIVDAPTAASGANFSDRGVCRAIPQQHQLSLQRTTTSPTTAESTRGGGTIHSSNASRSYGTIGPNFSEAPAQLYLRGSQPEATAGHIVQRGVYDPMKYEEDEFRPGNAFQSFDRAGWLSRLTYSWLNPLLTFGLLEPTLLRQERFLPALPEQLLSLDNMDVPAWRLWVHRKTWCAYYVAKPGELLIPSNEAMERAEEQAMSLADLHDADIGDDSDETESSEGQQTVVMLGHTAVAQASKFRPQRPKRLWEERVFWAVTAPLRYVLVFLFYYVYIGTSRTVRRTRRRLVRELLKDRLTAAAKDMYDENGYQAMEANEALEEATWALAEIASSCGSSAAAPSAGSALPTHMRRQLALSDVSLYHLFLELRCGRRFLLIAAPVLLLSELLTLSLVPVLSLFLRYLQRVDKIEILPGRGETPGDQESVTVALSLAALIGALLLLQGAAQSAYVSQVQQAAMEARSCVRAMVLEKTLALPLAQRTFSESEVVALATEEATRVAKCLVSLHHTWSYPLRVALLSLLLGYYLGWAAAAVACVGPLVVVPWMRHASHESRQSRHAAEEATKPRLSLLQLVLGHIREVKGALLEGRLMRRLRKAREAEAAYAEEVAMTEGTVDMLSVGVMGLLMVAALGLQCVFSKEILLDMNALIPTLLIFLLLSAPLLELPALFSVVARGFLAMKRIEAYLRQTPDEFVGTWVDLTAFSAMQQRLRQETPSSALLHYRRGSVVCRDSSFTWQHDLTEESPMALLHDVDMCIEPGQLVVVQGSMGSGKSTLLLSILGEINRCVTTKGSDDGRRSSATDYESESSFSVVSASEAAAAAAAARASAPPNDAAMDCVRNRPDSRLLCNPTARTMPSPNGDGALGGGVAAAAAARGIFVASPSASSDGRRRRRADDDNNTGTHAAGASASAEAALSRIATTAATAARNALPKSRDGSKNGTASSTSRSISDAPGSTTSPTEASQLMPAGLEDEESSTGGFLVFGSCAYCAEVPWLQNDTIRANIMSGGGAVQLERWYSTVLRACALSADVAALPQGDATVVGDRGELLSLSMRCRIAIARAVYSKSHVYLFDSVLSPLEPAIQEHIIREVFHKLLRKRTVILASNVGLRSLQPHRVFSLVEGGIVREDTELYEAVPSLNARSDVKEVEEEGREGHSKDSKSDADSDAGGSSHRSTCSRSSGTSHGTVAPPLPPLYAEEFEEPQEERELGASETFDNDPMAAATALLFDDDEDFGPRDALHSELGNRHDSTGNESSPSNAFFNGKSDSSSSGRRLRRTVQFHPRSPAWPDLRPPCPDTPLQTLPGVVTLPPPVIPLQDAEDGSGASTTVDVNSCQPSTPLQNASAPSQNAGECHTHLGDARSDVGGEAAAAATSEASSCSTGQYIRKNYAQQLEREKMLRHRHRLSFFICLRFMGGQVMWLLLTTALQQLASIGVDIWTAVWLAVMANTKLNDDAAVASSAASSELSAYAEAWHQLCIWASTTDAVFLAVVLALTVLTMVLTLLRTRAVYVGVYGTMHFIYNQIVSRILHAPASYFDSRIIALLTRVLESDANVAEYRVPGTAEVLLSCTVQVFFVAAWNIFVNPVFLLLLPLTISLFHHISQRHAVVQREVRKLETGSVSAMADILREVYQGASTVRCMALQDRLREEYCCALDTVNTASMVAYLADCWVELRLHVLAALAVCSAAMLGVVFTFSYSHPSLTAVAMIAALRAGPVLCVLCQSLGRFAVTEWISVQRLMSLWSVPQEPLTLEGDADLYNYSHTRRRASGFHVKLEGGESAPLVDLVGTPVSSPNTQAAASLPNHQQARKRGEKGGKQPHRSQDGRDSAQLSATPVASQSSLSAIGAASTSSSPSSSTASAVRSATQHPAGEVAIASSPLLELRDVSARYRTTLPYVLRHVNLAVYPRERLGVVGHTGQGKGSLFNVLMRLVDVIEGDVLIDGENAARVPYPVLRGWFGLIPQEPLLVQGSWRSNLMMGYHPEQHLFIGGANGMGDLPYMHIANLPRQKQQQGRRRNGGVDTCATTAPLASHLAAGQQGEATLSVGPTNARERNRSTHTSNNSLGDAVDGVTSLLLSDSHCSTDSARVFMDGDGQACVQYMESMDGDRVSRDVSRRPVDKKGSGVTSTLARAAWRLRDGLSPFRGGRGRCNTSGGGRQEQTSSVDARAARGNSSSDGGGRGGRHRCCSSWQPSSNSGAVPMHLAGGLRQPVEEAALWDALRAVGLDMVVEFDGGLDAMVAGGDGSETSLTESQCRLLCLARAILNKPPIVLLEDAVLSGAEAHTDRAIRRVLANELRDSTVIIIAHRMSTVLNLCTRVVAMREGTLLPIADLRSAGSAAAASSQLEEGMRVDASSTASLADLSTPQLAAKFHPGVMKQLSYYVE
ncbi:putative multidrug resistance protein [Leptomonas seymouri]|uniref:Putative multidrug resistance protein n=1 Tax=Leptomonas seymouri TaxID=5684 RepID=A0A0N1IAA8_LEPSE|nr:putative multidrug resistance protein [Leptomonas seymouri]|eukprot:KPI89214.1 putative multidrug resistance protein [Leptomonas seymouri]